MDSHVQLSSKTCSLIYHNDFMLQMHEKMTYFNILLHGNICTQFKCTSVGDRQLSFTALFSKL